MSWSWAWDICECKKSKCSSDHLTFLIEEKVPLGRHSYFHPPPYKIIYFLRRRESIVSISNAITVKWDEWHWHTVPTPHIVIIMGDDTLHWALAHNILHVYDLHREGEKEVKWEFGLSMHIIKLTGENRKLVFDYTLYYIYFMQHIAL